MGAIVCICISTPTSGSFPFFSLFFIHLQLHLCESLYLFAHFSSRVTRVIISIHDCDANFCSFQNPTLTFSLPISLPFPLTLIHNSTSLSRSVSTFSPRHKIHSHFYCRNTHFLFLLAFFLIFASLLLFTLILK